MRTVIKPKTPMPAIIKKLALAFPTCVENSQSVTIKLTVKYAIRINSLAKKLNKLLTPAATPLFSKTNTNAQNRSTIIEK